MPNEQLSKNQYKILHELSDDSIVNCYLAEDLRDGQRLIVREVPKDLFFESGFQRFENEARLTSGIRCANYSQPIDFKIHESVVRVSYRFIPGESLAAKFHRKALSVRETIRLACDLLTALSNVHRVGCVHRDIRPSNIIINSNGEATLCGYVPLWRPEVFGHNNRLGRECASFTSPELSGVIDHDVGESSDLYSLGYVLDAALAGAAAFDGDVSEILYQHMTSNPDEGRYANDTPSIILQFVEKLIQKEPRDRYQTASAALWDAQQILNIIDGKISESEFVIGSADHRIALIDPAFVGREETIAKLKDQLTGSERGGNSRCLISSPSGIGKTRLLTEISRIAARRNFFILHGRCSQHAAQEPSAPWLQMVDQLSNALRRDATYREEVKRRLESHREEIITTMPTLASVFGWQGKTISGPDESGQDRVIDSFTKVFTSLGKMHRPVLLTLDDAQWMDDQSKRVLGAVTRTIANNLALMVVCRPLEGISLELTKLLKNATQINLGPIGTNAVRQLAESMAGPLPSEAIEVVQQYAEGSPFMATAVLRGMVESQVLTAEEKHWRINTENLTSFQAAEDAGQILAERLSQLPEASKRLMVAAAVIGKDFNSDAATDLAGMTTEEAAAILQQARKQRLVWMRPNSLVSFVHDKIRETILQEIPNETIREMHGRFGRQLEETSPSRVFDLAYHFDAANLRELALPHSIKAAEIARKRFSLDIAQSQLSISIRAFEHATKKTRHRVEMMMADVLLLQGEYDGCQVWLDKASESAKTELEKAATALRQGDLYFKRGNKDQAAERFEASLKQLGHPISNRRGSKWWDLGKEIMKQGLHSSFPILCARKGRLKNAEDAMVLSLYSRVAHVYWYTRDKYRTLWAHLRGLNLAEVYEPTEHLAQCYSEHAPGMTLLRWQTRGLRYAQKSLQIREELQDIWGQGQSRNFLSIFLYSFSQFERCVTEAGHAVEILERTGDYWEVHIGRYQLSAALYRLGRLEESVEQAKLNYHSALRRGDYQATGNVLDVWARASLGEIPDEVIRVELERNIYDHQRHCQVKLAQGIKAFYQKQFSRSIECLQGAIQQSERAKVSNTYVSPCYAWLCSAMRLELENNPPKSRSAHRSSTRALYKTCQQAVRIANRFTNEQPHAYREYAAAAAMTGRVKLSKRYFAKSLETSKRQKASFEYALTQILKKEFALELGWRVDPEAIAAATDLVSRLQLSVSVGDQRKSISLLDRFDSLLEVGREISTSVLPKEIYQAASDACQRILRVESVCLVQLASDEQPVITFPVDAQFDPAILASTQESNATYICDQAEHTHRGVTTKLSGSFLCSPIVVSGKVAAYLYLTNTRFSGVFRNDELRIADYITTATGAALEKADGFLQLKDLNLNLERKVENRTAAVVERSKELENTANQLRAAQEKLKVSKEVAEAANEAKSSFLARMSHEIRTPIAAVLGFTELLLRGVIHNDADRKRHLETIHSNGTHLLHLLNEILDLSKIEADQVEVELVPCSPAWLIGDIVASMQSQAIERKIGLELNINSQVPETIINDPTRLRQILTNLIGNAIKFTTDGGVSVNLTAASEGPRQRRLEISVRDTGIGMTAEQMGRIFEPFTQADTSTTRKYGGTGLGLSISKGLAERLGGTLGIDSEAGCGTVITLDLATEIPEDSKTLSAEEARQITTQSRNQDFKEVCLKGMRVLVVDDQPTNRDLIHLLLSDSGASVSNAKDGREAIEELMDHGNDADVVLLDMQMPIMDGYTAARELRKRGFTKPIIAMTANAMAGDDQKCKNAGCSDYLAKPIDLNALLQKVRAALPVDLNSLSAKGKEQTRENVVESEQVKHTREAQSNLSLTTAAAKKEDESNEILPKNWLREFACELVDRVSDELPQLLHAYETGDLIEVARLAHWIKGSGGTVGLPKLSQIAVHCETAVKQNELDSILESIEEMNQFLNAVNQERESLSEIEP